VSSASSLFTPQDNGQPISGQIVQQAVQWLVTMQSGMATSEQMTACTHWRHSHPDHERAWQRLSGLGQDMRAGTAGINALHARETLRGAGRTRRIMLKSIAGFAVTGLGLWTVREQTPWQAWGADYRTATGELRTVTLVDGTTLVMGSQSAVDVQFSARERLITLRTGDVMVTTAKDAAGRPLIVATGSGTITPVGTRFTVRYEPALHSDRTHVAVMEGAVNVLTRRNGKTLHLNADQETSFTSQIIEDAAVLRPGSWAWTDGMLVADRMTLSAFAAELNRYRPGILRCDPAVADMLVSGAFPLNAPESVLAMLQETLPVKVRFMTRYWATIGAR
jgi:transmembrane sensor